LSERNVVHLVGRSDAGQGLAQLPAGADAELDEDLAQVPLDGPGADEQQGADLRVGLAVDGEPGDVRLLRGQRGEGIGRPPVAQ
jgi:hypothetical protein